MDERLRILFASPAYWPAHAFGGPVVVARARLARGRPRPPGRRGHDHAPRRRRATRAAGRRVDDRSTAPASPTSARRSATAGWASPPRSPSHCPAPRTPGRRPRDGVPRPRDDTVAPGAGRAGCRTCSSPSGCSGPAAEGAVKRLFDATLARGVASRRAPGDRLLAARARRRRGVRRRSRPRAAARQRVPRAATCRARPARGHRPHDAPVVLYVGRIAAEKGIEHLLAVAHRLPRRTWCSPAPTTATGRWTPSAQRRGAGRRRTDPCAASDPWPALRPLPASRRLRPGVRRRELRARRSRGGLGGHARGRLRPDRRRGVLRRRRGARRPVRDGSTVDAVPRVIHDGSAPPALRGRPPRPPARPGTPPSTSSSRSTPRRSTADNACGDSPQALCPRSPAVRFSERPATRRATRRRFSMLGS